jgi:hypothetical protein
LQALQQRTASHECGPDYNRSRPSKADKRRDREIAKEVFNLPTEPCAGLPIGRAQGDNDEQDQDGDAAKFQENTHSSLIPGKYSLRAACTLAHELSAEDWMCI